jgi:hypothetical protein
MTSGVTSWWIDWHDGWSGWVIASASNSFLLQRSD